MILQELCTFLFTYMHYEIFDKNHIQHYIAEKKKW